MRPKTLSKSEEADIVRAYHAKFQQKKWNSFPQLWYETIMEWLSWKYEGAELITRSVRDSEEKILQNPVHCKEYFAALCQVLDIGKLGAISEEQKALYLMMASSDERAEAILLIQS